MDEFERRARFDNIRAEEAAGNVADSMEVRLALMARVHAGEITLEDAQAQLKRIKSSAKRAGKITRNQAFLGRSAAPPAQDQKGDSDA